MTTVAQHLHVLAVRINDATSAAETSARAAVYHAVEAGRLLLAAKDEVEHGQWVPWMEAHCTVAPRTAQAYMRLAKSWPSLPDEKRDSVALLPLRKAMAAISTAATAPPMGHTTRPGSHTEAQKLRSVFEQGSGSLRHLARDFGMNKRVRLARVKAVRARLQAALAVLDSMVEAVQ